MANALLTLLDIAKMTGNDKLVGLIDETYRNVPELSGMTKHLGKMVSVPNVGAARTINGGSFQTLIRVALPTVSFRGANQGADSVKSRYENKIVETFILDPKIIVDKAVADRHEDGREGVMALEADGVMQATFQALGRQFYYGRSTGGDAEGHPGLLASLASEMTLDAGGTTDNTASSVWGVKFGPKGVQWIYGKNGSMEMGDIRIESVLDANNKAFTAYVQQLFAYPGLQCLNRYSIGRIKKLTEDSGKGLTDALLGRFMRLFPVGMEPDVLFATKRSIEQLRLSRTATNATGTPAPTPTEYEGIPILATESILDTEALAL